jgi:hypothetical protein
MINTKINIQIISYLTLRKLIGVIGIALPILLALGGFIFTQSFVLENSISSYYYTPMRDVFVGVLFVLGFFLLSYKGYQAIDNVAGSLGFVFALGVALFPAHSGNTIVVTLHFVSAALLFCVFIFFSLFLFTKTHKEKDQTEEKKQRNTIYKICGTLMLICLILIALSFILQTADQRNAYKLIFWLESVALWAFGVSWLVKGRFLTQVN